jgi:uncharacterized protein (TIGR00369 family)
MPKEKPPTTPYRAGPFLTHLGVDLISRADGRAHLWLDVQDWMRNLAGFVHGGILSTMADVTAGHAVISTFRNRHQNLVTTELHTSFLAPVRKGAIEGFGEVFHEGRTLVRARATLKSADGGAPLVEAVACFMILPSLKDGADE